MELSLLDELPHLVWVQKYREAKSSLGGVDLVKDGDPIPTRAFVDDARSWSDAEEYLENGLQLKNLRVLYAKTWPGDVNSHVFFDGYEFLTEGEVAKSSWSPRRSPSARFKRVRHVRVSLYRFGIDNEGISLGGDPIGSG